MPPTCSVRSSGAASPNALGLQERTTWYSGTKWITTSRKLRVEPQKIDIRATTRAGPGAVWRLLGYSLTWPSWTPIESVEIVSVGDSIGLGEVRTFTTGRVTVREEIIERSEEQRLSYRLLAGLAVRDYRADVELCAVPVGTEIRWHTVFRPKIPGTGWLYRRALRKATQEFVDGLASHSADGASGAATDAGVARDQAL